MERRGLEPSTPALRSRGVGFNPLRSNIDRRDYLEHQNSSDSVLDWRVLVSGESHICGSREYIRDRIGYCGSDIVRWYHMDNPDNRYCQLDMHMLESSAVDIRGS